MILETKRVTLDLSPQTYNVVTRAILWYHESLHMLTDPDKIEPELPLEQLTEIEKKRDIVTSHRLLQEFEGIK